MQKGRAHASVRWAVLSLLIVGGISYATVPGQPYSQEFLVNTVTAGDQVATKVAMDAIGNYVVVWSGAGGLSPDEDSDGVFFQRYDLRGMPQGTEMRVNVVSAGIQRNPAVAMDASGQFVVVWESQNQDGSGYGVYYRRYSSAGVPLGSEVQANAVTSGDQDQVAVAMSATGSFAIAWRSSGKVFARAYSASGTPFGGSEFQVSAATAVAREPAVGMGITGGFVIAWTSANQEGADSDGIFSRRYSSSGGAFGSEVHVNQVTVGSQRTPVVATANGSSYVVVWTGVDQDGEGIFARRVSNSLPSGAEFTVNTSTSGNQARPAITMDALGRYVVAWEGGDSDPFGVFYRRYSATSVAQGGELIANGIEAGDQGLPAIAGDADGDFAIIWQSFQGGTGYDVLARPFVGAALVDVSTSVTDSVDPAFFGNAYSYNVTVRNNNAVTTSTGNAVVNSAVGVATQVLSTVELPPNVLFNSASASDGVSQCFFSAGAVSCETGRINAASNIVFQIHVTAPTTPQVVTATANAEARQSDSTAGNNSDAETTSIVDGAGMVTLSLSGSPLAENGGVATVTASLGAVSGQDVTVNLAFSGTATSGTDYAASGTSIVIPAGQASAAITLTGVDDSLDEFDETVIVDIASVTNGSESGTQQVTATIADDDAAPVVRWSTAGQTVSEGVGNVTVAAELSTVSGKPVTISMTPIGTAQSADYASFPPYSLSIPAGSLNASRTITIVDDALDEADETLILNGSFPPPINATLGTPARHEITIVDNDIAPTVNFTPATASVAEGNSGTTAMTVTVSLSAVSGQAVTVPFTVSGTAVNPADHSAAAGSISIAVGTTSGAYTFNVVGDTVDEPDETIVLSMDTPTNANKGAADTHITTITDDDAATATVTLSLSGSPLAENGGVATVTANLGAVSGQDVTVSLAFSGTAGAGSYTASASSIVIPAGQASAAITLTGVDDSLDEFDETVIVDIASVTNGSESGTQQVTATIADDDAAPVVRWSTAGQTVSEGVGNVTVAAELSTVSGKPVTISMTRLGTAAQGSDYEFFPVSLVIPAGSLSASQTITIIDDTQDEADETLILNGSFPPPINATLGTPSQHTVTIIDND